MSLTNNNQEESSEKKSKFIKKSYPRPWEVELTKEERENLKKSLEDDENKYEAMERRLVKDRSFPELFNKKGK